MSNSSLDLNKKDSLLENVNHASSYEVSKRKKGIYEYLVKEYISSSPYLADAIKKELDCLFNDEHMLSKDIYLKMGDFNTYLISKNISSKNFKKLNKMFVKIVKSELEEKGYLCLYCKDKSQKWIKVFKYEPDLKKEKVKRFFLRLGIVLGMVLLFALVIALIMVAYYVLIMLLVFAIFCSGGMVSRKPSYNTRYRGSIRCRKRS